MNMERKEKTGFLSVRFLFRDPDVSILKGQRGTGGFSQNASRLKSNILNTFWVITPTLLFPVDGDENFILIKKRVHFISN